MKQLAKEFAVSGLNLFSQRWHPYSRLILANDNAGWVLDWEMRELENIARQLKIPTLGRIWRFSRQPQSLFYASQYFLTDNSDWFLEKHRIGFSYFHGKPGSGEPGFDRVFEQIYQHHEKINRIQVSHTEMRNVVLQSGIDPAKVFTIPIGINLGFFRYRDTELRHKQRALLGIPDSAFVVGSFQKDGVGWGDGIEPKLIKGPDIFVETLAQVKSSIPELFVLLTGPARGYVKAGLERLGIPYHHLYLKAYPDVGPLFTALDLYLVSSRQEGGPKSILESMAAGVPLVTTRVGQAMDLVQHGENAWMVDVEDVDSLAHWAKFIHEHRGATLDAVLQAGRATAEANSYTMQIPLWRDFMRGFVEWQE